eukprot:CAMPEP_0184691796 /NCGR_PEP_ID=MMETSP0313-20130426/528_1 /TAXON_ID=2792 /ORGANISM="Porphyridium aerugineum, Strain SAG 1380-2" /LENGTH=170 /DNA_ID=CAMNT_0027149561 /DNA_START=288 /DNA_END=800 /DNA_ORIENTATION=-
MGSDGYNPNGGHMRFMLRAIEIARQSSIVESHGGPFGCVIVDTNTDQIVAEGYNTVMSSHDPSAHGEMNAIRNACKKLGTHILDHCVLYTTSEPCAMCYGATWWSRIQKVFYASTIQDALTYGNFDDVPLAKAMKEDDGERRELPCYNMGREEMTKLWLEFQSKPDRAHY